MTDASRRQPAVDEPPHPVPEHAAVLAPSRQRAMPEPADLEPKSVERRLVHGHAVVPDVSTDHRAQPRAYCGMGSCMRRRSSAFTALSFACSRLRIVCRTHREPSVAPLLPADVREAEEVERLRFPLSAPSSGCRPHTGRTPAAAFSRDAAPGRNFRNRSASSAQNRSASDLTWNPSTMSSANLTTITSPRGMLLTPCLDPQVKHVVEIDVRQQRRCTAALRRPLLHSRPLPFLQHAGVQPFLDEPHDASVRNPVLDELARAIRGRWHRRTHGCRRRAPSSPSSSAVPCRARPAHYAGCAPAGTRTRSRGSPSRRWRSAPRRWRAGRFCPPARERRAVAAARLPSRCTPDEPASLGTPRASAVRTRSWRCSSSVSP